MVDAVVVDVVNAVHLAGSLIKERIEASRNLPEVSKKCISTIDQIEGAVDGVGDDRATAATLSTIRERLDELQLPPMVVNNEDPKQTAFTVSVDYKKGAARRP